MVICPLEAFSFRVKSLQRAAAVGPTLRLFLSGRMVKPVLFCFILEMEIAWKSY